MQAAALRDASARTPGGLTGTTADGRGVWTRTSLEHRRSGPSGTVGTAWVSTSASVSRGTDGTIVWCHGETVPGETPPDGLLEMCATLWVE